MKLMRLSLHDVSRRFGRHTALRNVKRDFSAGEIVLLLGPNGAGKTTLLRIASTLLRPSRGTVSVTLDIQGRTATVDLFDLAENDRGFIGLVSHASLIYHDLSGLENLILFAELYGLDPEQGRARSQELLEELELTDAADRRVAEYSRGMRQRLSIARALIQGPQLILLDEPFTGLDQSGCRILHRVLRRLREDGCLVMMITHHLELPDDIVDRAVLLKRGLVIRDQRPEGSLSGWYEKGLQEAAG